MFQNNWAFIENGVCTNMGYFESMEKVKEFRALCDGTGMYDDLVPEEPGFWIGDYYIDGVWIHPISIPSKPAQSEASNGTGE
ncbi:hypothetical protein FRZ06_10090 [Anoxybacterium hadale]|uniref:Uncharacterized protein n=1 Tax=Anoxybacterium hadale TaxID=3408580 RepID=A0ACD1ABV0_9FIRM|nr:hypothetical protein FRZ06_10090 [Clostridiales bacterium]